MMEQKRLILAEKNVQMSLELLRQSNNRVAELAQKIQLETNVILELNEVQRCVYETIRALQLRIKILRNIKLNWPVWQEKNTHVEIRLNQLQGLEQLINFLENENYESDLRSTDKDVTRESHNPLVGYYVQPTGAGKTGLFAIETALVDVKTLVLVPFDNLLYQTADDFQQIGGIAERDIGILSRGAPKELYKRRNLVATYGGHLARMKRDQAYRDVVQNECELIWCDEGHMALGEVTQKFLKEIDELSFQEMTPEEREAEHEILGVNGDYIPSRALKIAFTATPRLSVKHVREKFGRCIGRIYQSELVKAGINVPYSIIYTDGTIEENDKIFEKMTDEEEVEILRRENVYKKQLEEYAAAIKAYYQLKKVTDGADIPIPPYGLAFCTNHAECIKFKEEASAFNLRFEILTGYELSGGEKGRQQLREAEARLLNHEIDGFVTVEKLATGYSPNFVNTILWARVTSSARTVQGIGRGNRSHTYPGNIKKTHCTVIETNWVLSKNAKQKKMPRRLSDALYDQGEDPESICKMSDGSLVTVNKQYVLEDDGTVVINGRIAVGLHAYITANNLPLATNTLIKHTASKNLHPVPDVHVTSCKKTVNVFWKEEIDPLLPKYLDDNGCVDINGRLAVGINAYGRALGIHGPRIRKLAEESNIQPVPDVIVRSGIHEVGVSWKDQIDALLPKKIPEDGIMDIDGRLAVTLDTYVRQLKPSMSINTVKQYVVEAGLKPVPNVELISGAQRVVPYWKDEVDALLPRRLSDDGTVDLNGRMAISPRKYALSKKTAPDQLRETIKKSGLSPIIDFRVCSGEKPVVVYWKDEVDSLSPLFLDENGVVEINGRLAVGISAYAASRVPRKDAARWRSKIQEVGLEPIPNLKVRKHNSFVEVYWKDEIDKLLHIDE